MRLKTLGLLVLLFTAAALPASAVPRILLVARDLEERPLSGLRFAYGGAKSLPTTQTGSTELELPAGHHEGQPIKILLLPDSKRADDWFLVNPQVNIPSSAVSAEVVLMRRSAFRQLAAAARDASGEVARKGEPTAEDRKRILAAAAARHGLTAEQMETALRSFAETQDPKDRGIALYLEGQYAQAEELLGRAVAKQETDLVEALRYLGATQFEQGKYRAAADSFQKAVALRGEDTTLLNWLGRALFKLAAWAEAEPLMRRALEIDRYDRRGSRATWDRNRATWGRSCATWGCDRYDRGGSCATWDRSCATWDRSCATWGSRRPSLGGHRPKRESRHPFWGSRRPKR